MKVVQAQTDAEVMLLNAMPPTDRVFILEHENRRIYLVLDAEYDAGGHPAVYDSPEEVTTDFLHEAMHEINDVLDEF